MVRLDSYLLSVSVLPLWARHKLVLLWETLPADVRAKFLSLLVSNGDPVVQALLVKALVSGVDIAAIAELSGQLNSLSPADLMLMTQISGVTYMWGNQYQPNGPQNSPNSPFRQMDTTVCGPTSAIYVAAISDPFVALWIVTGWLSPNYTPPFLEDLQLKGKSPEQRMRSLQKAVQHRANSFSTGGFSWPDAAGISPWGMASQLDFGGTSYSFRPVDGADVRGHEPTRTVTLHFPWGDV
jgi:hypothetical protein